MDVQIDYVKGGDMADRLAAANFNINALRPFVDEDGKSYITANNNNDKLLFNANATLRKDEWIMLDRAVTMVARDRLRLVNDLVSRGLTFNLPNALAHTVMQYQNMSDINDAEVSMDGLNKGDNDRPQYDLTSLPIPIIHKDFYYSVRELNTSRNMGVGIDVSNAEMAARKVAETAEKLAIGVYGTYKFGGGNIYGLLNFPSANSYSFDAWANSAKTQETRLNDVFAMVDTARTNLRYGPFVLYVPTSYERYLDEDYKANSDLTLRQRILKIGQIQDIVVLDYMTTDRLVLLNLATSDFREVMGLAPTTIQWDSEGGMRKHFKIMSIMVPNPRADYNGTSGIVVGTGS